MNPVRPQKTKPASDPMSKLEPHFWSDASTFSVSSVVALGRGSNNRMHKWMDGWMDGKCGRERMSYGVEVLGEGAAELVAACADKVNARLGVIPVRVEDLRGGATSAPGATTW